MAIDYEIVNEEGDRVSILHSNQGQSQGGRLVMSESRWTSRFYPGRYSGGSDRHSCESQRSGICATFDTDYILIKTTKMDSAATALRSAGYIFATSA